MAKSRKIHKYTAGGSGSSTQVDEVKVVSEKKNVFLAGVDFLWERFPFSRYEYERWSPVKRLVFGLVAWLVVIPTWPLVVLGVLWVDTPKFRWSAGFFLLAVVAVMWLWILARLAHIG